MAMAAMHMVSSGVFGGKLSFKKMSVGGCLCTLQENPHSWVPTIKVTPPDGSFIAFERRIDNKPYLFRRIGLRLAAEPEQESLRSPEVAFVRRTLLRDPFAAFVLLAGFFLALPARAPLPFSLSEPCYVIVRSKYVVLDVDAAGISVTRAGDAVVEQRLSFSFKKIKV
jgi:hypothetical protein